MSYQTDYDHASWLKTLFQFLPVGMSYQTGTSSGKAVKIVSVPTSRNVLSDIIDNLCNLLILFQFLPAGMSFQTLIGIINPR